MLSTKWPRQLQAQAFERNILAQTFRFFTILGHHDAQTVLRPWRAAFLVPRRNDEHAAVETEAAHDLVEPRGDLAQFVADRRGGFHLAAAVFQNGCGDQKM